MSLHKRDRENQINENLDGLIRWALQDSVTDAEPSPQVWERIESTVVEELGKAATPPPARRKTFQRRGRLAWLLGAGAHNLVPGYPRLAEQRRLYASDMQAAQSVVCLVECTMPALRLVA